MQDDPVATAIIRGVFEIYGVLTEIQRDLSAIRLLREDDGEEEDHDG